jgi:integrase
MSILFSYKPLNENMRFSELTNWYFENIAPHRLKENTLYGNKKSIYSYVIPTIGNLKLKDISTSRFDILFKQLNEDGAVRSYYSFKVKKILSFGMIPKIAKEIKISAGTIYRLNNGGRVYKDKAEKIAKFLGKEIKELFCVSKKKEGLNSSTIKRLAALISSIFSIALKKDIITKNPVTNSTTPKIEQIRKPFFDEYQCKQLLKVLKTHQNKQFQVAIKVLLHTGLRSGELLGLRWPDLDFEHSTITVNHTLTRVNGVYKLFSPKTKTSERVIKISDELIKILKEHKRWQAKKKLQSENLWIDKNAVFTGQYGDFFCQSTLNTAFKKLLKKHNLPDITIHDLRHANASLLINAGLPTKIISEHLGHNNTLTTENIYAHVFNSSKAKISKAINIALT